MGTSLCGGGDLVIQHLCDALLLKVVRVGDGGLARMMGRVVNLLIGSDHEHLFQR